MYMDNIKLFSQNEKELETLIQAVKIYSQDIGMEFGIEKCAMLKMKNGKQHMTEGIKLPKQGKNQNVQRKGKLQVLGNIGSGRYQTSGHERKN